MKGNEVVIKSKNTVGRHHGRLIEHSLYELSFSGMLPLEEASLVKAAADYIHWLEVQIAMSDKPF